MPCSETLLRASVFGTCRLYRNENISYMMGRTNNNQNPKRERNHPRRQSQTLACSSLFQTSYPNFHLAPRQHQSQTPLHSACPRQKMLKRKLGKTKIKSKAELRMVLRRAASLWTSGIADFICSGKTWPKFSTSLDLEKLCFRRGLLPLLFKKQTFVAQGKGSYRSEYRTQSAPNFAKPQKNTRHRPYLPLQGATPCNRSLHQPRVRLGQ